MIAEMSAPRLRKVPSPPPLTSCQPSPGPLTWPCAAAIRGLTMSSVNALTRVVNVSAADQPTATTMTSPRIMKSLKPFSIAISPHRGREQRLRYTLLAGRPLPGAFAMVAVSPWVKGGGAGPIVLDQHERLGLPAPALRCSLLV